MNEKIKFTEKIKMWLLGKVTASLIPRVVHSLVLAALAYVFENVWPWIVNHGLDGVIRPQTLSDMTSEAVTAFVLLTAAAALGKPVKELQAEAKTKGLYDGEVDGVLGPKTNRTIERIANDQSIVIQKGRIITIEPIRDDAVGLEHNAP